MATSKIKSFDAAVEQVSSSRSLEEGHKEGIKMALSSGDLRKQKKTKKKDKTKKEEKKNKKKKPKKSVSMVASIAASTTPSPERSRTRQEGPLSHSSPTPTSSASSLSQPKQSRESAWSDADDEILEFVREETPADRTSGHSSSATSSSSFSSVGVASTPKSKSKMKQKQKKKKNGNKVKSGGVVVLNNSKDALPTLTSVHDPAEARSRPDQQHKRRPTLRDDVEFGWEIDKHNEEEEEEEVVVEVAAREVFDSRDDVEGDTTDNESGSCSSSRFGWQYKNDKLLAGRDWAEFYDNMRQHIVAGGPGREFLLLDEDAARVYARRSDADDFSCAVTPHNFQKNRYGNILPYNQNRVKLTVEEDQSDYVNASYVKFDDVLPGFHDRTTYIAASAPIASTVEDFYRMLWETETFGIVMLTRNVEEGRAKCHQYWPEESETQRHGSFTVTNTEEVANNKLAFVIRRLVIQNSKSGEKREVTQYHYLAWPDHGVPDSSEPLEEIIKLINAQAKSIGKTKEPTLVAHCSAGIGRTGAFILIHALLNYIFQEIVEDDEESLSRWTTRAPPTLDFVHMVQHMRNQRSGMIAQPEQYAFCYQTVLSNLGRALRYSPHKWDTASSLAKENRAAGGRRAMVATPTRQKSCILF